MCRVNSMYFSGTSCAAHVYNSLYKLRLLCHFLSGLQLEHLHTLFSMISTPPKIKFHNAISVFNLAATAAPVDTLD